MPLHKISDVDPNYRFSDHDIMGFNIYSGTEAIGSVDDILVDDEGKFRYLVMFTGRFFMGKRTLLPFGSTQIDYNDRCLRADALSHEQIEQLPEYDHNQPLDSAYEERIRTILRPVIPTADKATSAGAPAVQATPANADLTTAPVNPASADLTTSPVIAADADLTASPVSAAVDRFDYGQDAALYDLNEQSHNNLKLYEERLIADKKREKTGEVAIGKRIETETAQVSVPIEKERVIIERTAPIDANNPVDVNDDVFNEGEVARMDVYEETPDVQKEAFVREEIRVRKAVDRDVVKAEDQVRREQLDIASEGHPTIDKPVDSIADDRI